MGINTLTLKRITNKQTNSNSGPISSSGNNAIKEMEYGLWKKREPKTAYARARASTDEKENGKQYLSYMQKKN